MCCCTWYSFWPFCPKKRYIIWQESVLNGLYNFVWFCRWSFFFYFKYKKAMTITWIFSKVHFVLCPNVLGIFCLKQGQGFTPSVAQLYLDIGWASPRDSVLHPLLPHQSFLFTSSSTVLLHPILTLDPQPALNCPSLYPLINQSINQSINKVYLSTVALPGPRMRPNSVWVSFSHSTSVPMEEFD